jgi:antitoxin component YwqK of YwqJK toxin-antitoxin module
MHNTKNKIAMRYIILSSFIFFLSCKKEIPQKIYYPNGKLNYILNKNADNTKITFFDKSEKASMNLHFRKDYFTGSIVYSKNLNLPFVDSINIDSLRGPYFYGTEYIIFNNDAKLMGTFRYKRNSDFRKALSSSQPYGIHYTYDMSGNIIGKDKYMIINDTVYNTKITL